MYYESRPTWRYQWLAVVGVVAMLVIVAFVTLYGPTYLGIRMTQLVSVAAVALALYLALLMLYRHFAWRYLVDANNIESYQGVLARHVHSIRVEDLRNVNVSQTVMQRLLGVGDLEFSSAAGGDVEVVFFGVSDPMRVKEQVQRLQGKTAPLAAD